MWKHACDNTDAILTARAHVESAHAREKGILLPGRAVVFCMGSAMGWLKKWYPTEIIFHDMPKFIGGGECLRIVDVPELCFAHGGYGSPAVADTVETLVALGVRDILLIGMCGGFSEKLSVGDVIIPQRICSEEGTSLHYYQSLGFVEQEADKVTTATRFYESSFRVHNDATVTTDAVYRQTYHKENHWRSLGCSGVDMEASALLSVSRYLGVGAGVVLLVSDIHPLREHAEKWEWGNASFTANKENFIRHSIRFAIEQAGFPADAADPG